MHRTRCAPPVVFRSVQHEGRKAEACERGSTELTPFGCALDNQDSCCPLSVEGKFRGSLELKLINESFGRIERFSPRRINEVSWYEDNIWSLIGVGYVSSEPVPLSGIEVTADVEI